MRLISQIAIVLLGIVENRAVEQLNVDLGFLDADEMPELSQNDKKLIFEQLKDRIAGLEEASDAMEKSKTSKLNTPRKRESAKLLDLLRTGLRSKLILTTKLSEEVAKDIPRTQDKHVTKDKPKKKDSPTFTDEIKRIGTDKNIFKTIVNNIETLKELSNSNEEEVMRGIAVYKNEGNGKIYDFWNLIEFHEENGKYTDKTGFFHGSAYSSRDDLVEKSVMGETGFFVDRHLDSEAKSGNIYNAKRIITEIAKHANSTVDKLMRRNKPLKTIDQIIFYESYPLKDDDVIEICICKDDKCKGECTEIRSVQRKQVF
ncbi:hypothetical protein ENBRE01_0166 [Enteropsectra breve]|nr:hypothetical protein ENBRE01_0166 [Enteropsectra breve]